MNCDKHFTSSSCYEYHLRYSCKIYTKCLNCNRFYRRSCAHICGKIFFRLCFDYHCENTTCYIRPSLCFKQQQGGIFFLNMALDINDNPIFITINQIIQEDTRQKLDLIYSYPSFKKVFELDDFFLQNRNIFTKTTVKTDKIFDEILDFLYSLDRKITVIFQSSKLQLLIDYINPRRSQILNAHDFTVRNIHFKEISSFIDIPTYIMAIKLKLNPCLSVLPTDILDHYFSEENYKFRSSDFDLMHNYGNSTNDSDFLIRGLDASAKHVNDKPYYCKY